MNRQVTRFDVRIMIHSGLTKSGSRFPQFQLLSTFEKIKAMGDVYPLCGLSFIWLSMNLGHSSKPIWQWCRAASHIGQPVDHSIQFEATIEAIGEIIEIATQVLSLDRVRGELEITSVNEAYLDRCDLHVQFLGRGFAWLETGTHETLLKAAHYVETIEKRQGQKIACLEDIAWRQGWLGIADLHAAADNLSKKGYGDYLKSLVTPR